jgi:hypothetical protein
LRRFHPYHLCLGSQEMRADQQSLAIISSVP